MKEEWKDKLQCSMADFEEAVPEGLWQDIEERLSANDVVIGKAERRKPMRRTMVAGILATAACAACVVGFFLDREKVEVGSGDFTAKTQNAKLEYIEQGGVKHLAQNTANTSGVSPKATVAVVASQKSSEKHGGVMVSPDVEGASVDADAVRETTVDEALPEKKETEKTSGEDNKSIVENKSYASNSRHDSYGGKQKTMNVTHGKEDLSDRFSASLFASNSMSRGGSGTGVQLLASNVYNDAVFSSNPMGREGKMPGYYVGESEDESVDHHYPIRVGLSVRYSLAKRWGIETGLVYSYLSSDISQGEGDNSNKTEQKLHFVGIPLNVDYSLWSNRIFNVYAIGGGMVEKNVKGTSTATCRLNGNTQSTSDYKTKMKELQWSVNAALGVQVNFNKEIGMYLEPGVGYYFDNGSALKTYYTEKPFSFNLKLGLRYTISSNK